MKWINLRPWQEARGIVSEVQVDSEVIIFTFNFLVEKVKLEIPLHSTNGINQDFKQLFGNLVSILRTERKFHIRTIEPARRVVVEEVRY